MTGQVVRNRADRKRVFAESRRVHIERRGFHLNRKHAHLDPTLVDSRIIVIEIILGQNIADVERNTKLLRNLVCRFQKLIACGRCKRSRQMILGREIGVGTSAEPRNHVLQTEFIGKSTRRTDTNDIFHVKKVEKLVAVDRHGGHTHAARHDGNPRSLVSSRVSLDSADVIHEHGILQIRFRNKFCAKRISGHEDCFGEIAFFCCNMRCCHNFISFLFQKVIVFSILLYPEKNGLSTRKGFCFSEKFPTCILISLKMKRKTSQKALK